MKKLLILILFFISLASYSQIQNIGVGTIPNDGTGDPLRTAFIKVNNNFAYHSGLIDLKANLASACNYYYCREYSTGDCRRFYCRSLG